MSPFSLLLDTVLCVPFDFCCLLLLQGEHRPAASSLMKDFS